jgi:hypothetical protein
MLALILFGSCKKKFESVTEGEFTITAIPEEKPNIFHKTFCKYVNVYGVEIYASKKVNNGKVFHVANVLAQYIDNDEDGIPDNQAVLDKLIANQAFMCLWEKEKESGKNKFFRNIPDGMNGQDLYGEEINIYSTVSEFDATLEEVLHLVTHVGYSQVYPSAFGEYAGTDISNAMDIARGGHFTSIPSSYPSNAWYSYDDETCEYDCMVTEYIYWALTSMLGAQDFSGRYDQIKQEWKLNTRELMQSDDPAAFALFTDPQYNWPTVIPNGAYMQ